jgi:hypothetical protein
VLTAYDLYVHGDWTMENTAMRVVSGKDDLVFVKPKPLRRIWRRGTRRRQTDVVQDFAKDYYQGENKTHFNVYTTKILAEILYRSGFNTRAVNSVRGWK